MEDEIDIYGDLDHLDGEKLEITSQVAKELQQNNVELQRKVEELSKDLERINKYSKSLEANISSLHKTAKVEIARKDRMISDLRQQLDNAAFRRNANFRIPKKTPRPVVISLPPKDESTCTEIKKEEVNDTIKKEETEYQSPLIKPEDDADDTKLPYQPEKMPVTLFGERLKRRLEQEAREEAESADKAQQPSELDKTPKAPVNIDTVEIKEETENQYRLIPLTLQKLAENSRKRSSDNVDKLDRSRASQDNKRRRISKDESRIEKSPSVDRHKNSIVKCEDRKRMEIDADNVINENHTKRRHDDKLDTRSLRHRKTESSRSRSRSKSRERRDRRDGRRDCYSSSLRSKSSPHRSSKKVSEDRYGERRRENLRNSKPPIRKYDSPSPRRMDLRRRSNRRNDDDKVESKIFNENKIKDEMRRKIQSGSDTSSSRRRGNSRERNSRETSKTSHISKNEISDTKYENKSNINVDRQREMDRDRVRDRNKSEKSKSPSSERKGRNSIDEKIKLDERKQCQEICTLRDTMQVNLDDIEEGEIPDSPSHTFENQIESVTTDKIVAEVPLSGDDQLPTVKIPKAQNLDDSGKEEKIENIEMFIEEMQEKDNELYREGEKNDFSEDDKNSSSLETFLKIEGEKLKPLKTKIDGMLATSEKDTSDESVNLTNIFGDSSDEDVYKSNRKTKMSQIAVHNLMHDHVSKESKIADTVTILSTEKIPEKLSDVEQTLLKKDISQSNSLTQEKNTIKSSVCSETANEEDNIEEALKTDPISSEEVQSPRPILQEIGSPSKASVKSNDIQPPKFTPKEKENSVKIKGPQTGGIIVVARRRKVKLSDTSTVMTVVRSENTVKNQ